MTPSWGWRCASPTSFNTYIRKIRDDLRDLLLGLQGHRFNTYIRKIRDKCRSGVDAVGDEFQYLHKEDSLLASGPSEEEFRRGFNTYIRKIRYRSFEAGALLASAPFQYLHKEDS